MSDSKNERFIDTEQFAGYVGELVRRIQQTDELSAATFATNRLRGVYERGSEEGERTGRARRKTDETSNRTDLFSASAFGGVVSLTAKQEVWKRVKGRKLGGRRTVEEVTTGDLTPDEARLLALRLIKLADEADEQEW